MSTEPETTEYNPEAPPGLGRLVSVDDLDRDRRRIYDEEGVSWIEFAFIQKFLPRITQEDREVNDEEEVIYCEIALARKYTELGQIRGIVIICAMLLIYDLSKPFNPVLYGLFLEVYGGILLLIPSLIGPRQLAAMTSEGNGGLSYTRVRRAAEAVITNVALLPLIGGFVFQILAVVFLSSRELLSENLLPASIHPVWVVFLLGLAMYFLHIYRDGDDGSLL